jgi:ketosteroid isomerase-like protein
MDANVELVRAWVRALNARDEEEVLALVTPDFELVEPRALPGATHVRGREGLQRYAAGWDRNWSDWEFCEVEIFAASATHVVFVADLKLRGRNSGIDVQHRWVYLFAVRDGQIASQVGFDKRDDAVRAAQDAAAPGG